MVLEATRLLRTDKRIQPMSLVLLQLSCPHALDDSRTSKFSASGRILGPLHCQLLGDHDLMTVGKAVLLRAALGAAGRRAREKAGITLVASATGPATGDAGLLSKPAHLPTATLLWGSKDVEGTCT